MAERQYQESCKLSNRLSYIDLFRTPRLRKHVLTMIFTWMFISGLFDAHVRNIANLKNSIYITFTISAGLELPADLLTILRHGERESESRRRAIYGLKSFASRLLQSWPSRTPLVGFRLALPFWHLYAGVRAGNW